MEYKANVLLQNMIRKKCNKLLKQTFSQDIKLEEQLLISSSSPLFFSLYSITLGPVITNSCIWCVLIYDGRFKSSRSIWFICQTSSSPCEFNSKLYIILSKFNKHSIKKGQIITENRWGSNLFSGRIVMFCELFRDVWLKINDLHINYWVGAP